jgi:multiple sugar transport system substrate-binding protein
MQLVFQNGGALADEQGNPTFNTPEHLEALKFEQELVAAAAPEGAASHSFAELPALYEQGKCAMIFEGSWFPGQLAGEAPEIFEQTGLLPVLKGRGAKATQRIVGFYNPWMIFKQTKHPAEAIKFLDFMMQKDNLKRIYEATGMGPVYKSLSTDPIYAENPLTKELVSQVEQYSVDYWYPNNKAAVGIGTIGTDLSDLVVNPVLVGARSPEDALRDAQEQIGPRFEAQTQ